MLNSDEAERRVIDWLDNRQPSSSLDSAVKEALTLQECFRTVLAAWLTPTINEHVQLMSTATLAEKRRLAQQLNAALAPIGLGLALQPQHAFGTLIGHATKGEPEGRFSFRMREGGVIVSLGSAKRLANIYVGPRSEFKSRD